MLSGIFFHVFTLLGMWRPLSWQRKWKKLFYSIYIVICVTISTSFMLSLLIHFLKSQGVEEMTLGLFYFAAVFSIWIKKITVIRKRRIILDSKNILSNQLCRPRDEHESRVLFKYLNITR